MRDRQKQHKSGSLRQQMQHQFPCTASCERGWTVSIKVPSPKSINTTLIQAVTSIFKLAWIKQTLLYYDSTTLTSCIKCANTFPNFAWTAATHNISLYLSVRQLLDKGEFTELWINLRTPKDRLKNTCSTWSDKQSVIRLCICVCFVLTQQSVQ